MAILSIARVVPVVLFSGFIGVYVDRWDRKKIMIGSDLLRTLLILLIPLSIYFPQNLPTIYWVYILTFLYASADAWFYPARNASIPNLVEGKELVTANSLSQMTFQVVQLTIPPLGGVLIALLAPDYFLAFAINSIAFVLSAISLSGIKTNLRPQNSTSEKEAMLSQISAGAKVVIQNAVLSFIFVFAILLAVSSGILNALLVPHLQGYLGLSEGEIGLLMSLGAASGIVIALYLGKKSDLKHPLAMVNIAGIIAGIAVLGFSLAEGFVAVALSWTIIASVDVILNIPLSVIMQKLVADKMRGRVFSLLSVAFTSFQVIGMGIGGIWAETIGSTILPLFISGLAFFLVSIIAALYLKQSHLGSRLSIMLSSSTEDQLVVARTD